MSVVTDTFKDDGSLAAFSFGFGYHGTPVSLNPRRQGPGQENEGLPIVAPRGSSYLARPCCPTCLCPSPGALAALDIPPL